MGGRKRTNIHHPPTVVHLYPQCSCVSHFEQSQMEKPPLEGAGSTPVRVFVLFFFHRKGSPAIMLKPFQGQRSEHRPAVARVFLSERRHRRGFRCCARRCCPLRSQGSQRKRVSDGTGRRGDCGRWLVAWTDRRFGTGVSSTVDPIRNRGFLRGVLFGVSSTVEQLTKINPSLLIGRVLLSGWNVGNHQTPAY